MRRKLIIYGIIGILILAGCANNKNTESIGTKPISELYGKYLFEKQIYKNPLSSFYVVDGYKEYYTFTENAFTVTGEGGNQQKFEVTYEKTTLDENEFRNSFAAEVFGIPDISFYKDRYQYILRNAYGFAVYRIYMLDDEIWLAQMHKDNANTHKSEYIWSIYKITKLE